MRLDRRKLMKWIDRGADAVICVFLLVLIYAAMQVGYVASFTIPTDSMSPAVQPGDRIAVNKLVFGGRIFNMLKPLRYERFSVLRLPAFGRLRRDDAAVFNFPHRYRWDSVGMDVNLYYLKRIVALPGDTVEIRGGFTYVRESRLNPSDPAMGPRRMKRGYLPGQEKMIRMIDDYARTEPDSSKWGIVMKSFPNDSTIHWTIREFGPLFIPVKGSTIKLTPENVRIYRRYIEYETGDAMRRLDSGLYRIAGAGDTSEYTFRENYYFTQGDNCSNSRDSRYWGLLPEHCIVGKASVIWDSKSRTSDTRRWNRIGKNLEI